MPKDRYRKKKINFSWSRHGGVGGMNTKHPELSEIPDIYLGVVRIWELVRPVSDYHLVLCNVNVDQFPIRIFHTFPGVHCLLPILRSEPSHILGIKSHIHDHSSSSCFFRSRDPAAGAWIEHEFIEMKKRAFSISASGYIYGFCI